MGGPAEYRNKLGSAPEFLKATSPPILSESSEKQKKEGRVAKIGEEWVWRTSCTSELTTQFSSGKRVSIVKNACSCRSPRFDSQYPYGGSEP